MEELIGQKILVTGPAGQIALPLATCVRVMRLQISLNK